MPHFGELIGKIEILSIDIVFCRKFAAFCLSCFFSTHDATARRDYTCVANDCSAAARRVVTHRGVHGSGKPHGNPIPMGIPWEWE